MLSAEAERVVLNDADAEIEAELRAAFAELLALIRSGTAPRDAVAAVSAGFAPGMERTMSEAFSKLLAGSLGSASAVPVTVGVVTLSARLYAEAGVVGQVVQGIVERHVAGFVDSRALALELFEGYRFRAPETEPLQIAADNPRLPRYMRELLASDGQIEREAARAYAQLQVDGLRTPELRAAYQGALDALDRIETGRGRIVLDRRLEVAFFERMRYFAQRIARTELHRAFQQRRARELMEDTDLEFVQVRRAPGVRMPCICALFTGRDQYGLGPGVYPKRLAPVPGFHPFCMCFLAPRLDLMGRTAKERDDGADAYFLSRVGEPVAGRVMGSAARADRVRAGDSAEQVFNAGKPAAYVVKTVGQV